MYATVKGLPGAVQAALTSVGYGRADVRVQASTAVVMSSAGMAGCRAFVVMVDLGSGRVSAPIYGSWGGANMFTRNPVDDDDRAYELPANGAIITGMTGGGQPVSATVHVAASMVTGLLPGPGVELSVVERTALRIFKGWKASYRREELRREGIGADVVDGLVARGLLTRNRAGATAITTAGKNAVAA